MFVGSLHEEGLYNLYFHNCENYHGNDKQVSFVVSNPFYFIYFTILLKILTCRSI